MTEAKKTMVVLGLGESGMAMARLGVREGYQIRVADSRQLFNQAALLGRFAPNAQITLGDLPSHVVLGADLVGLSPGLSLSEAAVQDALQRGIPVVGEMELFARRLAGRAPVVAITGTNGKSTVTTMLGEMARACGRNAAVAGNISPAALEALLDAEDKGEMPDVWVLEVSSFQLETTTSLRAAAATVLNITEDHLDRYADIDDYAAAKARVFAGESCIQVLNRQDPRVMAMAIGTRTHLTFGTDAPAGDDDFGIRMLGHMPWLARGSKCLLPCSQLPVVGEHNMANALAALALGTAMGLPMQGMLTALQAFRGLRHRLEHVVKYHDVDFFDDSKGTNVGATVAAINGLKRKVVLIAGGDGKEQDFSPLAEVFAQSVRGVVLIGADARRIELETSGCGVPMAHARDMQEAVRLCWAKAQPGDAVLLSPACASTDMYRNYQHRAEAFIAAVGELIAQEGKA
ncbi:MAG: hypothetical protein RIR70_2207 [Pseudomonadota bacterium]|jgi:UDP-N-acetylmuramoylalanine--D-glutamate ligase